MKRFGYYLDDSPRRKQNKLNKENRRAKADKTVKSDRRQTRKSNQRVGKIFALTLAGVLLGGTLLLFVVSAIRSFEQTGWTLKGYFEKRASASSGSDSLGEEKERKDGSKEFYFFWENIPRSAKKEDALKKEEASEAEAREEDNRVHVLESKVEGEVTICFTGDILFDDEYAVTSTLLQSGDEIQNGIDPALLAITKAADLYVVNNEFPYTERGNRTEGKTYTFRADLDTVSYLQDMGADVAILANNHAYDFGEQGLLDSLDNLERAEIYPLGAGRTIEEAAAPQYFVINGMKIALIAATQIERLDNPDTKEATENSAGVFRCWKPERLCEVIGDAKEKSDFVIVCVHWGTENEASVDWLQEKLAPMIVNAGADLIIGDHPHCLQKIDYINGIPVVYSLGNYWFNSKTIDTGIVQVGLGEEGIRYLRFIPALQSGCKTMKSEGEEKRRILSYLRSLSPGILIDEDGFITDN